MGYVFAYSNLAKALVKDKISFFNTKQQSEIPMFVWYSQNYQVKNALYKNGEITEKSQNLVLYLKIIEFLAVDLNLSNDKFIKNLGFLISDLKVMDFEKLE